MTPRASFYERLSPEDRTTFKRQLAAIFIVITLLNLGFYWQRAFQVSASKRNVQSVVRGWDGLAWYVWMPAAPATLLLIRRFPFVRERAAWSAGRLVLGSAAIYSVVTNTRYLLRMLTNLWLPPDHLLPVGWETYVHTQLERTPLDFLTYCGLFATSFAIDYYTKYRQRNEEIMQLQLQSARLQSELARTQLTALRGQLQPHFLFNAFNAISTLVRQQRGEVAIDMIARLGELLRRVMESLDRQELPVEQELEFVRCYLDIERVRFGPRLAAVIELEPAAQGGLVPNLLLQPLVENAIKHGIAKRAAAGRLWVTAVRRGGRLLLTVADDGPGMPAPELDARRQGIGLRNTRRRLRHTYGADHRIELRPRPGGGTTVELDLPWREATGAADLREATA